MPTLDWIGKKAVLNHHNEVPFHLLRCNPELSVGEASENLLVQGDNLLALKALLPYYAGQVKCIYIDPPYNTGNEGWIYNDNVNSLEMREWLGKVVGGEAEDLSRHDKWLCMMYPRLVLLRQMLRDDGVIFISIDDNEVGYLRPLLDEIFVHQNFIACVVWQKKQSPQNDAINLSDMHDYLLVYAKRAKQSRNDKSGWQRNLLPRDEEQTSRYQNPDNDPRGPWTSADSTCNKTADERPNLYYPITNPITGLEVWPTKRRVWVYEQATFKTLIEEGRVWWGEKGENFPRVKKYISEVAGGIVPSTWWTREFAGDNQEAQRELRRIFSAEELSFATPKPTQLIRRILQISTQPGDLVLDAFAGSGTTGQAVLEHNEDLGAGLKFILIEMDTGISRGITYERLKRVAQGYDKQGSKAINRSVVGIGGGFRYCELGPTLFDQFGQIRSDVSFADLARHIFFTESGQPLPACEEENALLGECNGTAVYLLYNGVMRHTGNVLTPQTLEELPPYDGPKIIYADGCKIGRERLRELNVTFKQIPYQIKVR
jgi:site-specific DNA-methyltransferase (adenine-specific)/adenine-specific DNA-methyltransferase